MGTPVQMPHQQFNYTKQLAPPPGTDMFIQSHFQGQYQQQFNPNFPQQFHRGLQQPSLGTNVPLEFYNKYRFNKFLINSFKLLVFKIERNDI